MSVNPLEAIVIKLKWIISKPRQFYFSSGSSLPQFSQENSSDGALVTVKLQAEACNFTKENTQVLVLSCELCKRFRNSFFTNHSWTNTSELLRWPNQTETFHVFYIFQILYLQFKSPQVHDSIITFNPFMPAVDQKVIHTYKNLQLKAVWPFGLHQALKG